MWRRGCARLQEDGRNAFAEYQVPEAVLALKQGFGRLIRSKTDRGILAILDNRIRRMQYGKIFLESLPAYGRTQDLAELSGSCRASDKPSLKSAMQKRNRSANVAQGSRSETSQSMFQVSVEETFSAGHALRGYKGKCENLHGHNYRVRVTLEGPELDSIGLLFDFTQLKQVMREVIARLDHQFMNDLAPFDNCESFGGEYGEIFLRRS